MKHHFIDRFSYEKGFLQDLKPAFKFLILILLLFFLIAVPENLIIYLSLLFFLLILTYLSKIPFLYLLKRIILIIPFLIIIFLLSLFGKKEWYPIFYLFLKAIFSIWFVLLFTMTTKIEEFLKIFKRMPYGYLISLIISFLYRYFFLLEDEFEKMRRGILSKGKNPNFKDYLILSGNIFIRSYERSERVLRTMVSKGWKIK